MTIGERLLKYRKANNLSQEEVAEKLEVTRQTISKWETDQSTPDFDKIGPLCELFNITADELITGKKSGVKETVGKEDKEMHLSKGIVTAGSVFLYFLAVSWIIFASEALHINDGLTVSIFMIICAIATSLLIFYYASRSKVEVKDVKKRIELENEDVIRKSIKSIISLLATCIYFLISFWTMAWHITWLIWLIYAALISLVDLLFSLKGDKNE